MLSKYYRSALDEHLSEKITEKLSSLLSSYDESISKKTQEYFSAFPGGSLGDVIGIDQEIYLAQMLEEFIANTPKYIFDISSNYSRQFSDEL